MTVSLVMSRADYAARISSAMSRSLDGILEAGRWLIEAKQSLPHGDFLPMVEQDCGISADTAQCLMRVASDQRIGNADHGRSLPTGWRTLYELTKLSDEQFERGLTEGVIRPDMQRRDVAVLRSHQWAPPPPPPDPADTCTVEDLGALVQTGRRFSTIYADPPWLYGNQATRGATSDHYDGMTSAEVAALPVRDLAADDAHLHLWTTNAFLFDCQEIIREWGFEYKSCLVWVKPQMGMGNYWRVSHEFLLFGVRGRCEFRDHATMSWVHEPRGRHSAKPEVFRQLVEKVSPGPYLELFGRRVAPGWAVWGNEIERNMFEQDVENVA